ncbi:MAG: hypothetical protein IJ231_01990 [Clostridia bacterium]|nr:hypothetical protein [Clostridia bacterium]
MMKKMLALVLALCVTLAAVPVLAEEDVSGTWYLIMLGMTTATIDLNADGSCAIAAFNDGENVNQEGTWTQDGDKLSVIVNDQTLPLVHDGSSLLFDAEALASLGLEVSSLGLSGMDDSILSSLIQITRDPGKVTVAEFNAYQENGTLPEGKTEEDMQALQAEMMSFFMTMMGSVGGADLSGASESASAPELTIVEENFYVRDSYSGQQGVYIAKIQNQTEEPAYLSEGSLTLQDADGNEIGRADYMGITGSCYLEPGEATFVSIIADVDEGVTASVSGHTARLQSSAITYQTPDISLDVSAAELRKEEGYYVSYYTAATVTNTTDEPMSRISAVVAVRDADGKLVDLTSSGLYQNELAAGSTVTLIDSMDSRAQEYATGNGLTLDSVEAYAWINAY